MYDYTARVLRILIILNEMNEIGMPQRTMYVCKVRIIDPSNGADYAELMQLQHIEDWLTEHTNESDQPADRGILKELADEIKSRHDYLADYIVEVYETTRIYEYVKRNGWLELRPAV